MPEDVVDGEWRVGVECNDGPCNAPSKESCTDDSGSSNSEVSWNSSSEMWKDLDVNLRLDDCS